MCQKCLLPPSFNTSAQLGTKTPKTAEFCPIDSDNKQLSKLAKRKFLTSNLALRLLCYSEAKRETDLEADFNKEQKIIKSYRNMFYCNSEIKVSEDGKMETRFCKNRLCLICNALRTAKLIDKYQGVFDAWENDMYMVTLTISNVTSDLLEDSVIFMNAIFNKIKNVFKKQNQRGMGDSFEGIRKLECTSIRENDYHPHFHILVKGFENANKLKDYWIRYINDTQHFIIDKTTAEIKKTCSFIAGEKGQDIRKANKDSAKELFKYFTKIISKSATDRVVYVERLDFIFRAIRGKRVFQNFGFKLSDYSDIIEDENDIDNESESLEDSMFFSESIDREQDTINKKIKNFYSNGADSRAALELMTEFSELEATKKGIFYNVLIPEQQEQLDSIEIENSEDAMGAMVEMEMVKNQNLIKGRIKFDLADAEIFIPCTKPPKQFFFDYRAGNWFEVNKNFRSERKALFDFNISNSLKDIAQSFVYPSAYKSKIFELYEWKQSIKNLLL
jgi:hypothetical protein